MKTQLVWNMLCEVGHLKIYEVEGKFELWHDFNLVAKFTNACSAKYYAIVEFFTI